MNEIKIPKMEKILFYDNNKRLIINEIHFWPTNGLYGVSLNPTPNEKFYSWFRSCCSSFEW